MPPVDAAPMFSRKELRSLEYAVSQHLYWIETTKPTDHAAANEYWTKLQKAVCARIEEFVEVWRPRDTEGPFPSFKPNPATTDVSNFNPFQE